VVHSDRGGQVTYHGPGQLVMYTLLDLKRLGIGIRSMVERLEDAVLMVLAAHGVVGERLAGAPGVYVDGAKIAALGLRVRNGRTYHGAALNVDLDLEPFTRINPCGYEGMRVTSLRLEGIPLTLADAGAALAAALVERLGMDLDGRDILRGVSTAP
jgi:lipoyl(octanoyl) transferase